MTFETPFFAIRSYCFAACASIKNTTRAALFREHQSCFAFKFRKGRKDQHYGEKTADNRQGTPEPEERRACGMYCTVCPWTKNPHMTLFLPQNLYPYIRTHDAPTRRRVEDQEVHLCHEKGTQASRPHRKPPYGTALNKHPARTPTVTQNTKDPPNVYILTHTYSDQVSTFTTPTQQLVTRHYTLYRPSPVVHHPSNTTLLL